MRWLVDEMLPPALAVALTDRGHDAVSVFGVGLAGASDSEVLSFAVEHDRLVMTENFADFALLLEHRRSADQECVPVVFVRTPTTRAGGGLATRLAALLDRWARTHPEPYPGAHWP